MADATCVSVPVPASAGATVEQLATAWLASIVNDATRKAYARDLEVWLDWCTSGGHNPLTVRRTHVDVYMATLRQQGLAPSTQARRLTAVKGFFNWLVDEDLAQGNPAARVPVPKVERTDQPSLTKHELHRLLAVAETELVTPDEVALVMLLALCALRVSEVTSADVDQLQVRQWVPQLTVVGKGSKRRTVVVPPRAMVAVERACADRDTGPLLVNRAGRRMTSHNAWRIVKAAAAAAGFADRGLSPHALRRTATEVALASGVPLRDVQLWLGHASSTTTEWYDRREMTPDRSPGWHVQAAVA